MNAYAFEFAALDGSRLSLGAYRGQVILLVNTASQCGFTPQYAGLQALWDRYRSRGLVVIGVPSNDFGEQEPGTAREIAAFCTGRYAVDFPLTARVHVLGADAHPLYRWIAERLGEDMAPRWNFHKYLIGRDGELAGVWPSRVEPLQSELLGAIEEALAAGID